MSVKSLVFLFLCVSMAVGVEFVKNGKRYLCNREKKTFLDAKITCIKEGYRLMQPSTRKEIRSVRKLCGFRNLEGTRDLSGTLRHWNDEANDKYWIGASGEPNGKYYYQEVRREVPKYLYYKGQPDNNHGNQYCLAGVDRLFDAHCSSRFSFVCEAPQ